jgi:superfamily II DNA or RNA helicase
MADRTTAARLLDQLSDPERITLETLAFIHEPVSTTVLLNCLHDLEERDPFGKPLSFTRLSRRLETLRAKNLLTHAQQPVPEILEALCRGAVQNGAFAQIQRVVRRHLPFFTDQGKWQSRCGRALRELRMALYGQDLTQVIESLDFINRHCPDINTQPSPIVTCVTSDFDRAWLSAQPLSLQFFVIDHILQYGWSYFTACFDIIDYLEDESAFADVSSIERTPFLRLLATHYLLRGEPEKCTDLLAAHPESFQGSGARGSLSFVAGRYDEAWNHFLHDQSDQHQSAGQAPHAHFGIHGLFEVLCGLGSSQPSRIERSYELCADALRRFTGAIEHESYRHLMGFVQQQRAADMVEPPVEPPAEDELTLLFHGLCRYLSFSSLPPILAARIEAAHERAAAQGYRFWAMFGAELLMRISPYPEKYQTYIETCRTTYGIQPCIGRLIPDDTWRRGLDALVALAQSRKTAHPGHDQQLVWLVSYAHEKIQLKACLQKKRGGSWSRGRTVALARLFDYQLLSYLSDEDQAICRCIIRDETAPTNQGYRFDYPRLLVALIGHPRLRLAAAIDTPVRVVSGRPELIIEQQGADLLLTMTPFPGAEPIAVRQESPTRFSVIDLTAELRRIAHITGTDGLLVPAAERDRMLDAVSSLSSLVTLHSAVAVALSTKKDQEIGSEEADSRIHVRLSPYGRGLVIAMFVKPFAEGEMYLKPGRGSTYIIAEIAGSPRQVKRNLGEEEHNAQEVEEQCPILDLAVDLEYADNREWLLRHPEDCLQALVELRNLGDKIIIEWPEGRKIGFARHASLANLDLSISAGRHQWFEISGSLAIDQDLVIELQTLLTHLAATRGRFIRLDNGQFIALSQELKKHLEDISALTQAAGDGSGQGLVAHRVAAIGLRELADQVQTSGDEEWEAVRRQLDEIESYAPAIPPGLQTRLRDYQREGFYWLARLAHLNMGACLADDMGLGKTVQALALILLRADQGPTLVVAPTSVSTNWLTEISRFAPSLRIKQFDQRDRAALLQSLASHDVLVTTYTLLHQEADALAEIYFETIVLDEAQAIKNAATKRSQAAMALRGGFKFVTTGTPLENHLHELYNLFQFINPGLLGTRKAFNERFAIPIERTGDNESRRRFKQIIRPFVLRRVKSRVLAELPPRTEITLEVAMSRQERHLYEALRQNALAMVEQEADPGNRNMQILAHIMKLRQACCNPRLIDPASTIPSAKLATFGSLIDELIAADHKVLVFSQFVGHLDLIRRHLDKKAISYLYLDGGTGTRLRKERVEAFQAGMAELFLISLKAGGLGLNLTAADYVIHMDPWWNPAIEDQASDRAHRIGQTRPVTIYRLVCRDTIEEKIVTLHQEKRRLAATLLEGSDTAARLDIDELLDLLRDEDVKTADD